MCSGFFTTIDIYPYKCYIVTMIKQAIVNWVVFVSMNFIMTVLSVLALTALGYFMQGN